MKLMDLVVVLVVVPCSKLDELNSKEDEVIGEGEAVSDGLEIANCPE